MGRSKRGRMRAAEGGMDGMGLRLGMRWDGIGRGTGMRWDGSTHV